MVSILLRILELCLFCIFLSAVRQLHCLFVSLNANIIRETNNVILQVAASLLANMGFLYSQTWIIKTVFSFFFQSCFIVNTNLY